MGLLASSTIQPGQGRIGHREEQHFTKSRGFLRRARARAGTHAGGKFSVVLEIERREHDLMPGLYPQRADRAADAARSDDADPEAFPGVGGPRSERQRP
jgi:hypothetical protein